jgi:lysophospholipase L1-like esterase
MHRRALWSLIVALMVGATVVGCSPPTPAATGLTTSPTTTPRAVTSVVSALATSTTTDQSASTTSPRLSTSTSARSTSSTARATSSTTGKQTIIFLPYGDSKTVGWGDETKQGGYPAILAKLMTTKRSVWKAAAEIAVAGKTVADMKARLPDDLRGRSDTPQIVLFNLGTNDVEVGQPHLDPATWKAEVLYILDTMKAKWPKIQVYIARIWRSDENGDVAQMDDVWIPAIVAARPGWVHLGMDERKFLPGAGKRYVSDGLHPNHAGYEKTAQAWKVILAS